MSKGEEYKAWVRRQPCSHCPTDQRIEAHHLSGDMNQSGMRMKPSDFLTLPLCCVCHRKFHDSDRREWKTYDERIQAQRQWLLRTLIKAIEQGVLVAGDIPGPIW